jgi:hypothetical protein
MKTILQVGSRDILDDNIEILVIILTEICGFELHEIGVTDCPPLYLLHNLKKMEKKIKKRFNLSISAERLDEMYLSDLIEEIAKSQSK